MSTILEKIVEQTRTDLKKTRSEVSFRELQSLEGYEKQLLSLAKALSKDGVSVIAEVKKASPSKGVIRAGFEPVKHAMSYVEAGAAAVSVLTDKPFFQGDLNYLLDISRESPVPLLRKDFIIDPYQIREARAYGADAVLIIVAITEGSQLTELLHAAREHGLDALVECYDQQDLDRIDFDLVNILGVNNRNLNTFEVDLHRGISLLQQSPEGTIRVSESGLSTGSDLQLLHREGIQAALIGEYFMRQDDPGQALRSLLNETEELLEKENDEAFNS